MLKKAAVAVLIAAGLIACGSTAFAATAPAGPITVASPADPSCDSCGGGDGLLPGTLQVPSYDKAYEDFKAGGAALGWGAATDVAAAFTGVVADPVAIAIDTVEPGYIDWTEACPN